MKKIPLTLFILVLIVGILPQKVRAEDEGKPWCFSIELWKTMIPEGVVARHFSGGAQINLVVDMSSLQATSTKAPFGGFVNGWNFNPDDKSGTADYWRYYQVEFRGNASAACLGGQRLREFEYLLSLMRAGLKLTHPPAMGEWMAE